ncbi:MAG: hypothetical protein AAFS11_02120 [Planctomycetota bacterium]
MKANDWNIVLAGQWNRAILTPNWIARNLFGLPQGTPVEVLVPLEGGGAFQVKHGKVIVTPNPGALVLQATEATEEALDEALKAAKAATTELPRTPMAAAGINLRYHLEELPEDLVESVSCRSETKLSDAGHTITQRRRGETVEWKGGCVNIIVDLPTRGATSVTFNFELVNGEMAQIEGWVSIKAEELKSDAEAFLKLFTDEEAE